MVEMKMIDLVMMACFTWSSFFGIGYCLGRIHGEESLEGERKE